MKIKTTVKMWLECDGRTFIIGEDMAFTYNGDRYIGRIAKISKSLNNFDIKDIECNKKFVTGSMTIPTGLVSDCRHVYYD